MLQDLSGNFPRRIYDFAIGKSKCSNAELPKSIVAPPIIGSAFGGPMVRAVALYYDARRVDHEISDVIANGLLTLHCCFKWFEGLKQLKIENIFGGGWLSTHLICAVNENLSHGRMIPFTRSSC